MPDIYNFGNLKSEKIEKSTVALHRDTITGEFQRLHHSLS